MVFSFAAACGSRADDADIIAAFGVDDNQYSAQMRPSQNDKPVFGLRVLRVGNGDGSGIAKNRGGFLKTDGVLGQIGSGLVRIPFKRQHGES